MTGRDRLEALAESLATADFQDPAALVELHEALDELRNRLPEQSPEELCSALDAAVEAVTKLLWQEGDGEELALTLAASFTRARELFAAGGVELEEAEDASPTSASDAQAPAEVPAPTARAESRPASADGPAAHARETSAEDDREIDAELLSLFVSSCQDLLGGLEGQVLGLSRLADPAESIAEIKRAMHTLKGECGVLSLVEAQNLCHQAEDLVERCLESRVAFPEDAILSLADWLDRYVAQLGEDPRALPPSSQDVQERLDRAASKVPAEPGTASGEEPESEPVDEGPRVRIPDEVFDDPMLADVLTEMRQHLEDAEGTLLELSGDLDNSELVDVIFRAVHTIKGIAGFMQLDVLVGVAHKSETLMDDFRKGLQKPSAEHSDVLFRARDIMSSLLDALEGGVGPTISSVEKVSADLDAATFGDGPRKGPAKPKRGPAAAPARPGTPAASPKQVAEPQAASVAAPVSELKPAPSQLAKEAAQAATAPMKKVRIERTVKVGTERLDSLVDMVGELVIAQQMVVQDPTVVGLNDERLSRNLGQVAKITRDLQEAAMSLRMVPLRSTFQKMTRLVRDVSRKSGKEVSLNIVGEDTELDRNVVEEIGDPLIHLIRNAVDHGLEAPEDRTDIGKTPVGSLELRAYHQGGSIIIEIEDDGRGLDRERIFQKSVERGLLPPETLIDDVPDADLWQRIFMPGFSTAAAITNISGRGVGLDVVKRKIEQLRGKIEIESRAGHGTTFTLRLPLTLAIIDGMIVRIGTRRYVIPTLSIEQSFQPREGQISTILGRGEVVDVRGQLLPVHRLRSMLHLDEGVTDPLEGIMLLLESNDGRVCVLADEILGQQQVVIKSIGKALPGTPGISGAAILGDGAVALIVDSDSLVAEVVERAI